MKSISISGTSFLLPKNSAWKPLGDNYLIHYAEYGDIHGALYHANNGDILVSVIFFEDLVNDCKLDQEKLTEKYSSLFELISTRCDESREPTIICFGRVFINDSIRSAKKNTPEEICYSWFLDQFRLLQENYSSLYFIDLNKTFAQKGYENIYDDRNWYFAHCRLASLGISVLSQSINAVLNRHYKASSKVLVLDCDNTIWGGVVGEDGISGIVLGDDGLGSAFRDFQIQVKQLVDEGIILALCSKNNEDEVWQVFERHPFMKINRGDVVSWRINWIEKYENIKSIAEELDLGLDSFVFWDDNPIERNKMKNALPIVNTIEMTNEVVEWPRIIKNLECFSKFEVTEEDVNKTKQYHGRAKFVRDRSNKADIAGYLKQINLKPEASNLSDALLARAVQLCFKTNQYNLRTIRHSAGDLLDIYSKNNDFCFLVSLSDNYGDHGIVSLVCLKKINEKLLFLDTFLMSCRVLGRHLESWVLSEIIRRASKHGFEYLIGEFIPTERNIVANSFFENYGFTALGVDSNIGAEVSKSNLSSGSDLFIMPVNSTKIPYIEIYEKN